jgi:hypothetical protein
MITAAPEMRRRPRLLLRLNHWVRPSIGIDPYGVEKSGAFQKIKPHPSRILLGLEFRLQAALGGLDI